MKSIFTGFILLLVLSLNAQNVLTLEEAKSITLENNFGIKIAKNNVNIAENQTDKDANGYLPTVSAGAGINGSFGGSDQKFSNGQEASTSSAFTWGGNASIRSDYTLVDKRRDLTLDQLKEQLDLSNLFLRQTIEQNLLQVYNTYFEIARLSENVAVLLETLRISRERLRRADYQVAYGQGTGLDLLNAEVDIQRDSVNILNAKILVENEKRNLNIAMGRLSVENFTVEPITELADNLELASLLAQAKSNNVDILINRQNLAVQELGIDLIEAEKKPTISAGASYDFNYTDSPTGAFIDKSNARGLAANVSVNWNIFDGSRDIRKENVIINLANQKLQIDQLELSLERDIINAWTSYKNAIFVLEVEQGAVETNKENFTRTEEQLKIGRLTTIEFRQAQLNLLNAQTSLNNAKLTTKLSEIQLLALVGELIGE